jgi:hypothetical protein
MLPVFRLTAGAGIEGWDMAAPWRRSASKTQCSKQPDAGSAAIEANLSESSHGGARARCCCRGVSLAFRGLGRSAVGAATEAAGLARVAAR